MQRRAGSGRTAVRGSRAGGRRRLAAWRGPERDAGASSVELAFLGPALILLVFFAVQAGLYFYGRTIAVQTARESLSQLRLFPDEASYAAGSPEVIDYSVRFAERLGGAALVEPEVVAVYDGARGEVTVTVEGRVISLIPGIDLTARGEASGQVERFISEQP